MPRKKIVAMSILALTSIVIGGSIYSKYQQKKVENFNSMVKKYDLVESQLFSEYNIRNIGDGMKKLGFDAVSIDEEGNPSEIKKGYILEDVLKTTIIASSDSRFLEQFYGQAPLSSKFIKDNVDYIAFSPGVTAKSQDSIKDVGGLSFGSRIIAIDTLADGGLVKNPKTYGSIMAHEAQHGFDYGKELFSLQYEKRAFSRQLDFLKEQRRYDNGSILKASAENTMQKILTAEFLDDFGDDFKDVYPNEKILSKDLLDAEVKKSTLDKHKKEEYKESSIGQELKVASGYASFVLSNDRESAIREVYPIATDKKYDGSLHQLNAASALQYLCPDQSKNVSGADHTPSSFKEITGLDAISEIPKKQKTYNSKSTINPCFRELADSIIKGGEKMNLFNFSSDEYNGKYHVVQGIHEQFNPSNVSCYETRGLRIIIGAYSFGVPAYIERFVDFPPKGVSAKDYIALGIVKSEKRFNRWTIPNYYNLKGKWEITRATDKKCPEFHN